MLIQLYRLSNWCFAHGLDTCGAIIECLMVITCSAHVSGRAKIQKNVLIVHAGIGVVIHEDAVIPEYAHVTDAGADIYAIEDMAVKPHTTVLVRTGLKVAIPTGYEIQIRPRSGMSLKTTMRIANTPGTIDAGYRGEVCVIMENTGNLTYNISKGDKVAQMVITPVPMINWIETNELDNADRGEGGFGSTDQE